MKIRTELTSRLMGVMEEFHLPDLYYDSFTRRYGRSRVCVRTRYSN